MGEPDAVELSLQLQWATRQVEERDGLVAGLQRSIVRLVEGGEEAAARIGMLKTVNDALLREKLLLSAHVEQLQREKAELASENARLHVFAKSCAATAEAATKSAAEMRAVAEARSRSEELTLLAHGGPAVEGGGGGGGGGPRTRPRCAASWRAAV